MPSTSRRRFLQRLGLGAGAAAFPTILPRRVWGANDRIQVGLIGTGNRGNLLLDQLPAPGQIVAVADCFLTRAEEAKSRRQDHMGRVPGLPENPGPQGHRCGRRFHSGSRPRARRIHACEAGKDIYAEKPLTLYIGEGRALVDAVRKYQARAPGGNPAAIHGDEPDLLRAGTRWRTRQTATGAWHKLSFFRADPGYAGRGLCRTTGLGRVARTGSPASLPQETANQLDVVVRLLRRRDD